MKVICPSCLATNNVPKLEVYKKANCGKCKASLLDPHPVTLTSDNLEAVLESTDVPVIVDFWAPWCGPCKTLGPILDSVSEKVNHKIAKVNVDEEGALANNYKIRSIPTMIVFKDGQIIDTIVGVVPEKDLINKLNSY